MTTGWVETEHGTPVTETVFKVATYFGHPGKWRSAVIEIAEGGVEYQIGARSEPKPGMGPLTAFRTPERARQFICGRLHEMSDVVLRCEAQVVDLDLKLVPNLCYSSSWGRLSVFWSKVDGAPIEARQWGWRMMRVPSETVWCAWIKPIEVVK